MRYTPVELRHVRPERSLLRGYKRTEVDRLIEDVADSFEEVWRERGELVDKLEDVQKALGEVKQREALLASTLVAAEKTAVEQVEAAKREGEVIVAEAHQEARSITRAAQSERERLFAETRRVETLLRTALGVVEEARVESVAETPEQGAWPNRQDTREFKAVVPEAPQLPPVQEVPQVTEPEHEAEGGDWTARDFAWGS